MEIWLNEVCDKLSVQPDSSHNMPSLGPRDLQKGVFSIMFDI